MNRSHPYRWLNVIAFAAVIIVNYLAMSLPIGGRSTSEISDTYPTLITPAGYAFSIWSLIYLLLAGFVIYQASRGKDRESVHSIGIFFVLSCVFNIAWIFLWQYGYVEIALVDIVLLLLSLIVLYVRTRAIERPSLGEIWFLKVPFAIYLGWVSVATILNVSIALVKNNWNGFGISAETWAVVVLLIGAVLAVLVSFPYRDSVYPLVFVWAYIAIASKQHDNSTVLYTSWILAGLLFLYAVGLFFLRNRSRD
ncbi:tryptophan-rich sensory protein [Paenibacillus sp. JX-17]|uniref:Tryptophan-rich sensory protein n=1 Tax=Paenibacillus lacisoli TaxID=3064525 RepID=A0ABT9CBP3_9BACL|nr:tryptophan-rich sensory protein [Paenibacillus sp. JX-17]MDO7906676.1 tryptophan-rich sensory protein [Paenibacillus sp. JX-17]